MEKKNNSLHYDKSTFVINLNLNKSTMPMSDEQKKNHKLLDDFLKNRKK
jgi:hypothetical protein